jgi:hypothetical protein
MLELHPSPEELVGMLVDDELVALDLLLERHADSHDLRASWDDLADVDDVELRQLVPDPKRRGTVVTIARQLRQVGISIRPRKEVR